MAGPATRRAPPGDEKEKLNLPFSWRSATSVPAMRYGARTRPAASRQNPGPAQAGARWRRFSRQSERTGTFGNDPRRNAPKHTAAQHATPCDHPVLPGATSRGHPGPPRSEFILPGPSVPTRPSGFPFNLLVKEPSSAVADCGVYYTSYTYVCQGENRRRPDLLSPAANSPGPGSHPACGRVFPRFLFSRWGMLRV